VDRVLQQLPGTVLATSRLTLKWALDKHCGNSGDVFVGGGGGAPRAWLEYGRSGRPWGGGIVPVNPHKTTAGMVIGGSFVNANLPHGIMLLWCKYDSYESVNTVY
jgi:hypothetical protein